MKLECQKPLKQFRISREIFNLEQWREEKKKGEKEVQDDRLGKLYAYCIPGSYQITSKL